jgi:[NiFe] hydrogenase assembly HybE family chaperone
MSSSNNVNRLRDHYQYVYTHKMNDIPIVNNKLEVEVVGFVDWGHDKSKSAAEVGVLITPWFMNIVLLPKESMKQEVRVGKTANILFPDGEYSFLTQLDEEFGVYLTCSLFSPMFEFKTQEQARGTAEAVMQQLMQTKKFKQAEENKEIEEQRIKDEEILNKVSSRREFLRGGSNVD